MLLKPEWSGLKNLLAVKAATGELPELTEYTATGNPATFETNQSRLLTSFEIPFMPIQEGSGDPSPDNVRPIIGWAGITITANGQTIMVLLDAHGGTVYGGTVDLVTGVMTVTWSTVDLGSLDWVFYDNSARRQMWHYDLLPIKPTESRQDPYHGICSQFATVIGAATWQPYNIGTVGADSKTYISFPSSAYSTTDEVQAALLDIPLVYELNEPYTVQLTPVEIKTIIGQNSISASNNGTNTIKYLKRG